ncbi:unnamed protein product [Choristocarpus tenellus]
MRKFISYVALDSTFPLLLSSCNNSGSCFVSPVLSAWTALVTVLVGSLLGFHIYLLCKGQTTNEYLRGEKRRANVPRRSFLFNCQELWCGVIPDSLLLPMHLQPTDEDNKADATQALETYSEIQEALQGSSINLV